MNRAQAIMVLLLTSAPACLAEEPASPSPVQIVQKGLMQFDARFRSADASVREAEFDAVMADKAVLQRLLGDDAAIVWPRYSEMLKKLRASTERGKKEFDRQGEILQIEVIDVREENREFARVLKIIPKDVPVFRAVVRYVNGVSGSSAYVVVDGKMRIVKGMEGLPMLLEELKKGKE